MGIDVSIIVPTNDRPLHLARTLRALMAQIGANFEVIVVADDCGDETFKVIDRTRRSTHVQLTVVRFTERSAARARNRGVAAASGRNCLFLDTDVLVPQEFMQTLCTALRKNPSAVLLTPLYGNSASSLIWPLLVNDDAALAMREDSDIFEWASRQMKLRDIRIPYANPGTGSLDHLPAPWVFCWSSALAVSKHLIDTVGGFAETFEAKGSEDIELGIRLSKAGATFTLMLNTYVFHLPHDRDRTREESGDLVHALRLLATHTTVAVEALCAFDCANANPMIEILGTLAARLGDLTHHAASRSTPRDLLCLPQPDLIIGPPSSWFRSAQHGCTVVYPIPADCAIQVPLFGFALPFEDKLFRVACLTDLWQILPERLACRLFDEALRVAEQVFLLKDSELPITQFDIPAERLAAYDTPYWERTHRLRRSFYDFRLAPLARAHELSSYQLFPS